MSLQNNNLTSIYKSRAVDYGGYIDLQTLIGDLESQGYDGINDDGSINLPKNTARGLSANYNIKIGNAFGLEQISPSGTVYNRPATRIYTSNITGYFAIGKYTNTQNFVDYLTINPSGFVGINNTNPKALLDVNGDVKVNNISGSIATFNQIFASNISFSGAITEYIVAKTFTGTNNNLINTTGDNLFVNNFTGINSNLINLNVNNLTGSNLYSLNIQGINSNFTNFTGTNLNITGTASINNYTGNNIFVNNLNLTNLTGLNANIKNITGTYLNITGTASINNYTGNNIFVNNLNVLNFTGTNVKVENVVSEFATFTNISGTNLVITDTAYINNFTGNNLNVNTSTITNDLYVLGNATKPFTQFWTVASDKRVKKNIEDLNLKECLDSINKIKLKKFNYIDNYKSQYNCNIDKKYIGVIADELEETHPDSVIKLESQKIGDLTFKDFKTIDTSQQFYELIGCIQFLTNEIKELKAKYER